MKPIVKKILESGLIDKHTALLMEKWKALDEGSSNLVGKEDLKKASEASLIQFAEEVEEIIDGSQEARQETRLAVSVGEPILISWVLSEEKEAAPVVVFRDEMGNFIFPPAMDPNLLIMNRFRTSDGSIWVVTDITALSIADQRYAFEVSAKCVIKKM
jgi:hypothetical protein